MKSAYAPLCNLHAPVFILKQSSSDLGLERPKKDSPHGQAHQSSRAAYRASKGIGADIAKGGSALAVQAHVSKQSDVIRLFSETKKAYDKLNILVNNAGVYQFAPLEAVTEESFYKQCTLNVLGLLLATREAVKLTGPEGGSIINIGSGVSTIHPPNSSVYTATKSAIDAITGVLAKELAKSASTPSIPA